MKLCVLLVAIASCTASQLNRNATSSVLEISNDEKFRLETNKYVLIIMLSNVISDSNTNSFNSTETDVVSKPNPVDVITVQSTTSEIEISPLPITTESVVTSTTSDPRLPPNTFVFNGTEYYFNTESKREWFGASYYCRDKDMKLVEIYSAEENNWIANKIKELGFKNKDFWTGGFSSTSAPNFKWNISKNITFTNWADGEPRAPKERRLLPLCHCILLTAATDFKWSSRVSMDNRNYFICKEF